MYYKGGVFMATISIRLDERDEALIKGYASMHHLSISDLVRKTLIEAIENEIDVKLFDKAVAESKASYTLEEAKKELRLL
jgi:hypothetical protein